jgi:hypothetical protein
MSFNHLPFEIRLSIWSLAVEPRTIQDMRVHKKDGVFSKRQRSQGKDVRFVSSPTRPPAIMHVCRESRRHAPYQRAFTAGCEPRWTWVNFALDIFSVDSLFLIKDLLAHKADIQQLSIGTGADRDWYESATNGGALRVLHEFTALRVIQVVLSLGGYAQWGHILTDWGLGKVPQENITFIDQEGGLVLPGTQLAVDWQSHEPV